MIISNSPSCVYHIQFVSIVYMCGYLLQYFTVATQF